MNIKKEIILYLVLIISFLTRLFYIFKSSPPWWDTTVYAGMAKYIYSAGAVGLWEPIRPLLWPVLLGFFGFLGLDLIIIGKILILIFSIGSVYLTFLLGKRFNFWIGIISSSLLSFMPLYFSFSNVTITDIPVLFFSLLAVYLFLKQKYFSSGLVCSIAFNIRFPYGLLFFSLLLSLILIFIIHKINLKKTFLYILKLCLGFSVFTILFLIFNYFMYNGKLFLPFIEANKIMSFGLWLWQKGFMYYIIELLKQNFILIFGILGLLLCFKNYKNKDYLIISIIFLVFFSYFTYIKHKEFRYIISVLPYLMILTALGIDYFKNNLKGIFRKIFISFIILLIISYTIGITLFVFTYKPYYNPGTEEFYKYFTNYKGEIITSNPMFIVYSNDLKINLFYSWEQSLEVYNKYLNSSNYIVVDGCELYCLANDNYCNNYRDIFLEVVNKNSLVFNKSLIRGDEKCEMKIYKIIKR